MSLLSHLGVLSQTHLWLYGLLYGRAEVGTDGLGNRYFRGKAHPGTGRERRWVVYAGAPEASAVPPEWHAWLHHTSAEPPVERNPLRRPWQRPHLPNQTGTDAAYRPPGHQLAGGRRAASGGDYQPWTPPG